MSAPAPAILRLNRNPAVRVPTLRGTPIRVVLEAQLTASRGRLLSGSPQFGHPVHAASFIRQRKIVIETQLLGQPELFRFILLHEIFHFVWARLGNGKRAAWTRIIEREREVEAKGELGESASIKKSLRPQPGTRLWRDYVCESFCDSAAHFYSGPVHPCKLEHHWKAIRRCWFLTAFASGARC